MTQCLDWTRARFAVRGVCGVLAALACAALLAACGGSDGAPAEPAAVERRSGFRSALAVAAAPAAEDISNAHADRLLDFGEAVYPDHFAPGGASALTGPFRYRHYPGSGSYLGVVTQPGSDYSPGTVVVLGGVFGAQPVQVGRIEDFIAPEPPRGFVARQGRGFVLAGQPFRVAGANAAQVIAHRERSGLQSALMLSRGMGANVVRFVGASEIGSADGRVPTLGSDPAWRPYFQSWDAAARRVLVNEGDNGLRHLDHVIYMAREQGLRMIIALVDNWDGFFGGVNQYVLWHGARDHAAFFTDAAIRQTYRDWVHLLLTRVNSYTGTRYADEPAIMAWELINEPSCYAGEQFPAGECHRNDIEAWIAEMSAYVKSLAPRQLVAVGDQGHFGTRESAAMGWPYRSTNEPDFETVMRLPQVDFGTYHLYPHDVAHGDGSITPLEWGLRFIRDHEAVARAVGKPALLEEVGARDFSVHADLWSTWLPALQAEGGAGFLFWGIGARFSTGGTVWDAQGYSIYPDSPGAAELRQWIGRFTGGG